MEKTSSWKRTWLIRVLRTAGWIYIAVIYLNTVFFPGRYLLNTPLGGKGWLGILPVLIILFMIFSFDAKKLSIKQRVIGVVIILLLAIPPFVSLWLYSTT